MGKIKYKEVTDSFAKIAVPGGDFGSRKSIGTNDMIEEVFYIKLDKLIPFKNQAREIFDEKELSELAESIKSYGIRQPLTIIRSPFIDDKFEIVSGERRARAAEMAGLDKVPCIVLKDYKEAEAAALLENIHRSNLHPVELARAIKSLISTTGRSAEELFKALGISRTSGYETLRILDLSDEVLKHIVQHNIRDRDTIRTLQKSKDPLKFLKKKETEPQRSSSVMRVSLKAGEFSIQKKAIAKLSNSEKSKLRILLEEILKEL